MINHQELREKFKPKKIKVLFLAESPPENDTFFFSAKGGFYNYTKQVFIELFEEEIEKYDDFLHYFQNKGYFLDDLCHDPKTFKEIRSNKNIYIKELRGRLKLCNPQAIIITLKRINGLAHEAIEQSNISIKPELIFTLSFPGNGWQNEYKSGLRTVLNDLITKNILT